MRCIEEGRNALGHYWLNAQEMVNRRLLMENCPPNLACTGAVLDGSSALSRNIATRRVSHRFKRLRSTQKQESQVEDTTAHIGRRQHIRKLWSTSEVGIGNLSLQYSRLLAVELDKAEPPHEWSARNPQTLVFSINGIIRHRRFGRKPSICAGFRPNLALLA